MPRDSIFDPEGEQTEHSGTRFMGPRADNISHMPPDVVDGKVSPEEAGDLEDLEAANDQVERERDAKTNPEDDAVDEGLGGGLESEP